MLTDESALLDNLEEEEEEENPPLIEWMKEYTDYAGPKTLRPTLEEVRAAIKDDFPELYASDLDLDHLLEALGIHVIAEFRKYTVAWFGTTDAELVEGLLTKYQQQRYSNVRGKLGIKYLWILKLSPKLGYTVNDMFEASLDFSLIKDKPECIIIDL